MFLESSQRPARFSQGFQSRLATPAALAVLPLHPSVAFTTDSMAGSYPRSRVRHPSASWLRRREEPIRASCYQGDVMTPHLRSPEERRHWPASGESRRLGGTRYAGWVVCVDLVLYFASRISLECLLGCASKMPTQAVCTCSFARTWKYMSVCVYMCVHLLMLTHAHI